MVRSKIETVERTTISSLITTRVHARDKVKSMLESDLRFSEDFIWTMHMKYEYIRDLGSYDQKYDVYVNMINSVRPYGYEYLGNTPRLVITPLTDRCHRSLFMALTYNYGGAPEGPVGTGKTETTKDLAKCLARHCFVFNCSSSLNYLAMTKFFKGLTTSGAWSCFDEFNRIELSVLSVISQIIIEIQGAIREKLSEIGKRVLP